MLQGLEEVGYVFGCVVRRGGIVPVDGFDDFADFGLPVDHSPDHCPYFVQGIDGFKVPCLFPDRNDDRFPCDLPGYKVIPLGKGEIFQVACLPLGAGRGA